MFVYLLALLAFGAALLLAEGPVSRAGRRGWLTYFLACCLTASVSTALFIGVYASFGGLTALFGDDPVSAGTLVGILAVAGLAGGLGLAWAWRRSSSV